MNGTLLKITGDMAHFKNSRSAILQQTYKIPPISTVIGILKNIYGENIKDFIFGYNFTYLSSQYEIMTIYKELNMKVKTKDKKGNESYKFNENSSDRFTTYPSEIEYLINPKLEIITIGLENNSILNNVLNLGKTNCLAKLNIISDIKINNENIQQNNIITDIIDGDGIIERQNIETQYNEKKGVFDFFTKLIRINNDYNCKYSYEVDNIKNGLYLWKYNKVGDLGCYNELI